MKGNRDRMIHESKLIRKKNLNEDEHFAQLEENVLPLIDEMDKQQADEDYKKQARLQAIQKLLGR